MQLGTNPGQPILQPHVIQQGPTLTDIVSDRLLMLIAAHLYTSDESLIERNPQDKMREACDKALSMLITFGEAAEAFARSRKA